MTAYPQLADGSMSQYPLRKVRRQRTVINRAADGSSIRLADPGGEITEWLLSYSELSDGELATLKGFFEAAEGTLNGFTFLDPAANLLAWSEDLNNAVWQRDPFLATTAGTGFWRVSNSGGGTQGISQTIQAPGGYAYCLSAYARSATPVEITLALGSQQVTSQVSDIWARMVVSGRGEPAAESVRFALELPVGATVDIRGIQAEAQPTPSVYRVSTTGGVYEDARFGGDVLEVVTTGPNRHSCTVKIIHANHL